MVRGLTWDTVQTLLSSNSFSWSESGEASTDTPSCASLSLSSLFSTERELSASLTSCGGTGDVAEVVVVAAGFPEEESAPPHLHLWHSSLLLAAAAAALSLSLADSCNISSKVSEAGTHV